MSPGFMFKNVLGSIVHNGLTLEIALSVQNMHCSLRVNAMDYTTAMKMSDLQLTTAIFLNLTNIMLRKGMQF